MEKSVTDFSGSLKEVFGLSEKDWKQYSPLTLAYLGDAVYELVIRTVLVKRVNCQPQKLHHQATSFVSAKTQARMIAALKDELTGEEQAVYRRGRNAKPYAKAKNASMQEYLEATGFEAVMGYLYLQEEFERMGELVRRGMELVG